MWSPYEMRKTMREAEITASAPTVLTHIRPDGEPSPLDLVVKDLMRHWRCGQTSLLRPERHQEKMIAPLVHGRTTPMFHAPRDPEFAFALWPLPCLVMYFLSGNLRRLRARSSAQS